MAKPVKDPKKVRKVTRGRRGPLNPQTQPCGMSPKCIRVHTPWFYRNTVLADLPPPKEPTE
jgi:hypothetical protein